MGFPSGENEDESASIHNTSTNESNVKNRFSIFLLSQTTTSDRFMHRSVFSFLLSMGAAPAKRIEGGTYLPGALDIAPPVAKTTWRSAVSRSCSSRFLRISVASYFFFFASFSMASQTAMDCCQNLSSWPGDGKRN